MRYLNDNFWQTVAGFALIVIVALGLLYLSLAYNKKGDDISKENYLAGSESED